MHAYDAHDGTGDGICLGIHWTNLNDSSYFPSFGSLRTVKGLSSRITKICPIQYIDENAFKHKSTWDIFKNNNNKFENQSLRLLWQQQYTIWCTVKLFVFIQFHSCNLGAMQVKAFPFASFIFVKYCSTKLWIKITITQTFLLPWQQICQIYYKKKHAVLFNFFCLLCDSSFIIIYSIILWLSVMEDKLIRKEKTLD